jgi:hypothetical protein
MEFDGLRFQSWWVGEAKLYSTGQAAGGRKGQPPAKGQNARKRKPATSATP